MKVNLGEGTLSNAWENSFEDKKNKGQKVQYYRCMVNFVGEKPMQLRLRDFQHFEEVKPFVGKSGKVIVDVDCEPGRKQQVTLLEIK